MKILLWEQRNIKNISLRKLEEKTQICKSKLWRIENGVYSPTIGELELIAKALNIKITDLFESVYK